MSKKQKYYSDGKLYQPTLMPLLQPCPFCGSEAGYIRRDPPDPESFDVGCTNSECFLADGADYWITQDMATRLWNSREPYKISTQPNQEPMPTLSTGNTETNQAADKNKAIEVHWTAGQRAIRLLEFLLSNGYAIRPKPGVPVMADRVWETMAQIEKDLEDPEFALMLGFERGHTWDGDFTEDNPFDPEKPGEALTYKMFQVGFKLACGREMKDGGRNDLFEALADEIGTEVSPQ